jgi:hypothetical protein
MNFKGFHLFNIFGKHTRMGVLSYAQGNNAMKKKAYFVRNRTWVGFDTTNHEQYLQNTIRIACFHSSSDPSERQPNYGNGAVHSHGTLNVLLERRLL